MPVVACKMTERMNNPWHGLFTRRDGDTMLKTTLLLFVPFTLSLGCDGRGVRPNDNWQAASQTDEGTTCVKAGSTDKKASIHVNGELCLSSSCSRNIKGSCDATLDGSTITVTSQFDWEENVGVNVPCTYDCISRIVECGTVGPLPAGTYTLVHGTASEEVVVPNDGDC